jgi:hypothetical protein
MQCISQQVERQDEGSRTDRDQKRVNREQMWKDAAKKNGY